MRCEDGKTFTGTNVNLQSHVVCSVVFLLSMFSTYSSTEVGHVISFLTCFFKENLSLKTVCSANLY